MSKLNLPPERPDNIMFTERTAIVLCEHLNYDKAKIEDVLDDLTWVVGMHIAFERFDKHEPASAEVATELFELQQAFQSAYDRLHRISPTAYLKICNVYFETTGKDGKKALSQDYDDLLRKAHDALAVLSPAVLRAHVNAYDAKHAGRPRASIRSLLMKLKIIFCRHDRTRHRDAADRKRAFLQFVQYVLAEFPQIKAPKRLKPYLPDLDLIASA